MCGIAGYINLNNKHFSIDWRLLQQVGAVLAHRGPDGAGVWACEQRQISLVHRRLSIVDLTDAGKQPMTDADDTVVITFNGEIYNYLALKAELEGCGYRFKSKTDTEVILYAYKQWGIDCLHRLDGMFAFALFDKRRNELYLVRDRVGIKPLYFSLQAGILSFASEIKALWQLPWVEKKIKPDAVSHYLTYLATPAPMTLYDGIYKLPAGFYIKVDKQRAVTFREWYDPVAKAGKEKFRDFEDESFCIEGIRSLLKESVTKRMMADVPVGVFLSGGVDSSLNVALMAEYTDKLNTFNVSFADGPELEERAWARKVANHFGAEHHELIITEKEAFDFFDKMVHHQDEPLGDSVCVPLYYVAQLAKDAGVTVVQIGEGADELFCGYPMYAHYLDMHRYWNLSQRYMPAIARKGLSCAVSKLYSQHSNRRDLLQSWADGRALFWSGAVVFSELSKRDVLHNGIQHEPDPILEQMYPGFPQSLDSYAIADYHRARFLTQDPRAHFLKEMIYLELKHRLPELLLMRVDKMAMAASVEARVPFLDHKLVEFALQIPQKFKYRNGVTKYILKKAAEKFLPHEVIYRKKMGFAAPVTRWFKDGSYFKSYMHDMLHTKNNPWADFIDCNVVERMMRDNEQGVYNYSYHLWALHNLMPFI